MRRNDREVKDKSKIEAILRQCKTCHVAMVDDGMPYVVPLSYGYQFVGDSKLELFFHSALEGKKLNILKKNNQVCFEMAYEGEPIHTETPCSAGYYYASVIGYGKVEFIEDDVEKGMALAVLFKHQTGQDVIFDAGRVEKVCIFKIVSEDYTGKKKL